MRCAAGITRSMSERCSKECRTRSPPSSSCSAIFAALRHPRGCAHRALEPGQLEARVRSVAGSLEFAGEAIEDRVVVTRARRAQQVVHEGDRVHRGIDVEAVVGFPDEALRTGVLEVDARGRCATARETPLRPNPATRPVPASPGRCCRRTRSRGRGGNRRRAPRVFEPRGARPVRRRSREVRVRGVTIGA